MDPGEVRAVLAWSALPFVGERALLGLLKHAREARTTPARLWAEAAGSETGLRDLARLVRLDRRASAALESEAEERWKRAGVEAQEIAARGVDLFVWGDAEYPAVLEADALSNGPGARPWPVVFGYGAIGLLDEPRVALTSSATVTEGGLAATDAVADALARRDVALATSTSRAAYQAAATAAKRHAGPAVLVLDRGIREAFPAGLEREPVAAARVWDEAFDPDLQLLLSPFGWRERWSPRSGPRRDALIFDVADAVVAVDIRPGGVMARECERALTRGKRVLALDRGPETPEGTRRLLEDPRTIRIPWSGGEEAARAVTRLLGAAGESGGDRAREGWAREIALFLARACTAVYGHGPLPGGIGAFPGSGPMARVAGAWSRAEPDPTAGSSWLLADLVFQAEHPPSAPIRLLERVRRGGLLAAAVPAAWLEEEAFAAARAAWLKGAQLRVVARLPLPAVGSARPAAGILLQRDGTGGRPGVFSPGRERMGRFDLRRYLQEVLGALGREPAA